MTTYSIPAPNGKTYQIDGPPGATDDQVRAQVLKQYPEAAGSEPAPAATPAVATTKAPADPTAPLLERWKGVPKEKAVQVLQTAQQSIMRQLGPDATEDQKSAALNKFNADPRMAAIRKIAGMAPLTTRRDEIRKVARSAVDDERSTGTPDSLLAFKGGVTRSLFGIPERLAALGLKATGGSGNLSYDETLDAVRAKTDRELELSTGGNVIGQVVGSLAGGRGAGNLLAAGGTRLVATGLPIAQKAGNFLQSLMTLKKGQTAANAAKVITTGAAGGATQAVGEGSDPTRGAVYGGLGAGALVGLGKGAVFLGRPVADFLGLSSAKGILRRYTSTTAEELAQKADDYRAKTGAEPTVFELLPLEDRDAVKKAIAVMPSKAREKLSGLVQERAANIGPEMAQQTGRIIEPQQNGRIATIADNLAASRSPGARPTPDEAALAGRAARSPVDMEQIRADEARNIMAPHDNNTAYDDVTDLLPVEPVVGRRGSVTYQDNDPEVSAVLRSAAGSLRRRNEGEGITIREVSDMISDLRKDAAKGGIEGRTAGRAVDHLETIVARDHPEASAAMARMTDAYAGRSRMMEGTAEGARTRLREDVPVTDRAAARGVRNAYDTPEGSTGRALGQASRLERDVMQSPSTSLRAVDEIAANPTTQEAISRNLGSDAGERIATAAQAQGESARNLAGLTKDVPVNSSQELGLSDIARSLISISPGALPATRLWSVSRISRLMTHLPEGRSNEIVDALFSQNPSQIAKAMKFLDNAGDSGKQALRELGVALLAGKGAANLGQKAGGTGDLQPLDASEMPQGVHVPEGAPDGGNDGAPVSEDQSPYAPQLQEIYDTESPELLDLISRVQQQESGGDQSAVSSAGAVGVMQVMPNTAPEAAQAAGVPFDPVAYKNDAAYNKLIGIAYLGKMLEHFDGDVEKALAAYNAGAGRVEDAIAQDEDNWLQHLPAETQEYVERVA